MKNSKNVNSSVEQVLSQVIAKCWQDDSFKSRLVNAPIDAIRELDPSFSIPEGKTLVVRDQTNESTLYINIPPVADVSDVEMTEAELEVVAGGRTLPYSEKKVYMDFISKFNSTK